MAAIFLGPNVPKNEAAINIVYPLMITSEWEHITVLFISSDKPLVVDTGIDLTVHNWRCLKPGLV